MKLGLFTPASSRQTAVLGILKPLRGSKFVAPFGYPFSTPISLYNLFLFLIFYFKTEYNSIEEINDFFDSNSI